MLNPQTHQVTQTKKSARCYHSTLGGNNSQWDSAGSGEQMHERKKKEARKELGMMSCVRQCYAVKVQLFTFMVEQKRRYIFLSNLL